MSSRGRRRAAWIAALALLIALAGLGGLWSLTRPPAVTADTVILEVEPGTSVRSLARQLAREEVIRSPLLFEAWVRVAGDARRIQAGTYALPLGRSLPTIIDILVEGRTLLASLTVPEGLRLEETAGRAARALGVDSAAFMTAATDSAFARSLGISAATLEGYLFPETYRVDPDIDARDLARVMVAQFQRVLSPAWRARADSLGRSVHEIVTLASIVEEEAKVPAERQVIAGVFWNRLTAGMPLEADPTVQYALGGHRARVLYRDLEIDSPYNTYRSSGLPPGPIASPGRSALEATLYPDSVPYFYFFAVGEGGRHTFSETFAEHNRKRRDLDR